MSATIKATDDGPLLIKGSFTVLDGDGVPYMVERAVVALCRCGRSQTKPFCDGSHARTGFRSAVRAAPREAMQDLEDAEKVLGGA